MSEKLAALLELFPHYSADILTGVLEAENYNLEAAIDSVVRLEAEAPKPPAAALSTGFLEPDEEDEEEVDPAALAAEVARMQLADELGMQEQLERIIREESKQPGKPKGSWKQKLKSVFKRKQKLQPQAEKLQEPLAIDEDEEEVISFVGDDKLAKGARVEDTAQRRKT